MASTDPVHDSEHPLLRDRGLAEEVLDVMYAAIHKILHKRRPDSPRGKGAERALVGGASADDVLAIAFAALLAFPHQGAEVNWRALGVTIAGNKAKDALKASNKGLRGTSHRHKLSVESGDAQAQSSSGEPGATVFELHPDERYDPEEQYIAVRSALDLRDLAREELEGRELDIFLQIKFLRRPRKDIGAELGLTGQRVGQIYDKACRHLESNTRYPYNITE